MKTNDPITDELKKVSVQNYLAERQLTNTAAHARGMKRMFKGIVGSRTRGQYAEQVIGDYGLAGR